LLVLRKVQLDALREIPRRDFEQSLIRHFSVYYAADFARAGREQFRKLVQLSIERAAGHGYFTREEVGLYCNLMLMLGAAFDTDPQIPWALEQANDASIEDTSRRIQRLFQSAVKYLSDCFGSDGAYMARALVRLRDYDLDAAPQREADDFDGDLLQTLERFLPQKFQTQGEEVTAALIQRGIVDAYEYGLESGPGVTVYITLMYMIGAGFDRDPIYPWAAAILNDKRLGEAEKVDALHRSSIAYVNQVLGR
jgi:hypothetical protein